MAACAVGAAPSAAFLPDSETSHFSATGGSFVSDKGRRTSALGKAEPSPLDVLLRLMRFWLLDGKLKEAAEVAKAVAPYLHAKASDRQGADAVATMKDDDLAALARSSALRAGVAAKDQGRA